MCPRMVSRGPSNMSLRLPARHTHAHLVPQGRSEGHDGSQLCETSVIRPCFASGSRLLRSRRTDFSSMYVFRFPYHQSFSLNSRNIALQAGDHVHLGPGVTGTRVTDPAFPIEALPPIDVVVLSHFHAGRSSCSAFVKLGTDDYHDNFKTTLTSSYKKNFVKIFPSLPPNTQRSI